MKNNLVDSLGREISLLDKSLLLCAEKNPSVEIQLNCNEEKCLVFLNKCSGF